MKNKLIILAGSALAVFGGVAVAQTGTSVPTMHRDHNAPETRQQVIERVQQRFERLDLNHDGRVTGDEIRQARAQMRQQMQDRMFDRMDLNHDGSITREEMAQAHAQMRERMQQHRGQGEAHGMGRGPMGRHRMGMGMGMGMGDGPRGEGRFGAQGDFTLDQMRDRALQRFDRLDLNHDGVVTAAEREQARAQMRSRMEQRRGQFRERMHQRLQGQAGPDGAAPSQPQ